MIRLIDGTTVDPNQIYFDTVSYHFTLNGQDITANITRADKIANWPTFDPSVDNTRLYSESRGGSGPIADLDTSTLDIFTQQVLTDPLAAPLDALNSGVNKVLASSGVQKIGLVLGVTAAVITILLVLKRKA